MENVYNKQLNQSLATYINASSDGNINVEGAGWEADKKINNL
jgi:hypothetical protein